MATPVAEKAWTHRHTVINSGVAFTDFCQSWIEFKEALVAAGGVVQKSSNGNSSGAADYWATVADITQDAGEYSWVVIRFSGYGPAVFEVMLAAKHAAGPGQYLRRVSVSVEAYSGGNTTTLPTSAKEIVVLNDTGPQYFLVPNAVAKKIAQSMYHAEGFRIAFCYNSLVPAVFGLEKIKVSSSAMPATDQWIVWYGFDTDANANIVTNAQFWAATNAQNWSAGGVIPIAFKFTGEAISGALVSEQPATNPLDGASWPMCSVGIYTVTDAARGYGRDGQIYDLFWVRSANACGSTFPGDGSKTWCQLGCLAFPWDGTAPEVS